MSETLNTNERLSLLKLKPKAKFEGRVTAIELYGAFVDIGAERDGLVHISRISENRVNRVADALNVGDVVTVWVQEVEPRDGRVNLTMIEPPERALSDLQPDQVLTGTVTKLAPYGAFVDIGVERDGLVHISEMAEGRTEKPSEVVQVGGEVQVRVVKVDQKKRRIELSLLNIPGAETKAESEEEEEGLLTAMESAWQTALQRHGMTLKVSTHKNGRRQRKAEVRRQQAQIIARTLRTQKD